MDHLRDIMVVQGLQNLVFACLGTVQTLLSMRIHRKEGLLMLAFEPAKAVGCNDSAPYRIEC